MNKLITTGLVSSILLTQSIAVYAALAPPLAIECESSGGEDTLLASSSGDGSDTGGGDLLGELTTLFTDLVSGLVGSFNLAKVVDLHQLFNQVMSGTLAEEVALSNASENNLPQSYAHRADWGKSLQRQAAIATVTDTTLGEDAQVQTRENCLFANDATEIIFELGEDSQSLDTSQQILQNISGQLGQRATIDHLIKEELTLMRQDLALTTVLDAQIAQQIHESNLSERRANVSSRNLVVVNGGLVTLPGGLWEQEE